MALENFSYLFVTIPSRVSSSPILPICFHLDLHAGLVFQSSSGNYSSFHFSFEIKFFFSPFWIFNLLRSFVILTVAAVKPITEIRLTTTRRRTEFAMQYSEECKKGAKSRHLSLSTSTSSLVPNSLMTKCPTR